MAANPLYYEHSGHFGIFGQLLMIVFGGATAIVLGALYGYLLWYNPFVYVNFIATIVYGALCGMSVGLAAKWGKMRNAAMVLLFGLAAGLFGLYTGWVAWLHALTEQSYFAPDNPAGLLALFAVIAAVAEEGVWTMFGWTPKGGALYTIWVGEAVMIVGCAVLGSINFVDESANTFCDRCNRWAEDLYTSPLLTDVLSAGALKTALERRDYQPLLELQTVVSPDVPGSYTRVSVQGCSKCRAFFCLDVERVELGTDSDGDRTEKASHLIDTLLVDEALRDRLQQRFGRASR